MSRPFSEPLRIFVVEDHPDTLQYLAMFLEDEGHLVQSAGRMDEAVRSLGESEVDVLICDIGLPDGDGWNLIESIELPPFAIAMSGFGTKADRKRSEKAGFREHLVKPFPLRALKELLIQAKNERDSGSPPVTQ